jgi:hypothetical protein
MMHDLPRKRSVATTRRKTLSTDALFTLTLIVGVLIGLMLMILIGYGLIIMDDLNVIDVPYVDPSGPKVCPSSDLSACPTCEAVPINNEKTPTPSATPDLAATATSACADFQETFPGTPCP